MCVLVRTPGGAPRPFLSVWRGESRAQPPGAPCCFLLRAPSCDLPPPSPKQHRPSSHTGLPQAQKADPGPRGHQSIVGVGGAICMKGPAPSKAKKRGRSGVGTLCSAAGPQTAGHPDRVHHGLVPSAPHPERSLHR